MREQPPEERVKNFDEVALGYTAEEAVSEAKRCLHCDAPMCIEGCPVGVDIPKFVKEIAGGKFDEAAKTGRADKASRPFEVQRAEAARSGTTEAVDASAAVDRAKT
jgi:Fe-S oxidoreductase